MRPAIERHPRTGVAYTVAGALFFALNASISKAVLEAGIDPQLLTILRTIGAMVGLAAVVAIVDRRRLRVTARELPQLAMYGVVGVALVQWLYFVAIDRLSVSLALLLEFTAPVLVALWARFVLRETVRPRVWGALALALGGLGLVAEVWTGLDTLDLIGVAAGLAASASLAAYWLIGERAVTLGTTRDPLSLTFWGFVFATIVWLPFVPSRLDDLRATDPMASMQGVLASIHVSVWLLVAAVIGLGTVVPFALEVAALQHLTATQVGLIAMLEPVLATLVAWVWLQQVLSGWQVLGVGVVVSGIALAQTARRGAPIPVN